MLARVDEHIIPEEKTNHQLRLTTRHASQVFITEPRSHGVYTTSNTTISYTTSGGVGGLRLQLRILTGQLGPSLGCEAHLVVALAYAGCGVQMGRRDRRVIQPFILNVVE